eukprot:3601894-Amphidinium_carterae.1
MTFHGNYHRWVTFDPLAIITHTYTQWRRLPQADVRMLDHLGFPLPPTPDPLFSGGAKLGSAQRKQGGAVRRLGELSMGYSKAQLQLPVTASLLPRHPPSPPSKCHT